MLTHYVVALLVTAVTHFVLAILVYAKGRDRLTNVTYALYSLAIAWWSSLEALGITRADTESALLWWRVNHVGVIFIPIFFVHFVISVLDPAQQIRRRSLVRAAYTFGVISLLLDTTPLLIREVVPKFSFRYFINPGPIYLLFFTLWVGLAIYGLVELFRVYISSSGAKRNQLTYFYWSMFIAYLGGVPNFFPTFNIEIPYLMPFGTYAIPLYALVTTYAIVYYRLMDIRIAVTRGMIFVVLHTLALGVPFFVAISSENSLKALAGERWWVIPFGLLAMLSWVVPGLYRLLQYHTEERLFKKERQYQAALRTMSQELVGFADVASLQGFVSKYVADQMGLASAELSVTGNGFGNSQVVGNGLPIGVKDLLQRWMASPSRTDAYILAEPSGAERPDVELRAVQTWMARTGVSALVPGWLRNELISCLALGPKRTGEIFMPEDFEVLEALARQSALVIKNLELFEEVAAQKRLAEFGELMNAINHEFNNVFVIISGTLQLLVENPNNPALKQELAGLQEEILRGQYIIRSASAYRKKHRSPLQSWSLATILEAALAQAQQDAFAGAKPQFTVTTSLPKDVEVIGRETMPELLTNCLRCLGWACDSKPGTLKIEVIPEAPMVQMRFAMTGGEDLRAVIEKEGALAPEPGRHGGLYYFLVKLIVADHQGSLAIESTPGGGTTIVVRLPQEQAAIAQAPAVHGEHYV